ncbi:sodium/hydrogen exchanger [Neurospora crassa]|uniref:Sodium/hydrogen exchanger n=1 Tax=Neurospora crassa (strain ATCC 24698 / 74-OR23-1A / CBS 708.71 / DSM 1257 / FGSC 987) TaxID=367110 RepID=Q7RXZ1_NEUCR|nr:sodium/hydrogen exchanger 3 [Neurospora crassa OR74A]EAA27536.2 sodium/hydrogen exchanger 3 [Neurospora crassa OR74A]KHE87932.1 sodium/hydrogen exchanger [Neurospora crassa]|eukprot:XP_956772.2 sodium/hydrogen exchanger 3 [Neurospora crassa OR74A]
MLSEVIAGSLAELAKRDEEDPGAENPTKQEMYSAMAIFIFILLLMTAFFTSYIMQERKIQAVHETVVSIFAGMVVGLIIRISGSDNIQSLLRFSPQIFFNLLLPPIILSSGYELHQANFFRNIGTILTFAFAGTAISAVVIGVLLWLYTRIPLEGLEVTFREAIQVGASLSATDPVTILAIFNSFKVDPQLYTVIFGESILNDAIAIVIFESAQHADGNGQRIGVVSIIHGIWYFLKEFFGSLAIGSVVGILAAVLLKFTYLRRYPKMESCMIVLIAYSTYFFSQAIQMSGIVSLLFCGITLKHYAYFNMSRRTQLTTKFFFQVLAQLSENFIFIYLGLSLFTEKNLEYQPLLIIITVLSVCAARWLAVFPLSRLINWFIRYRARRHGREAADVLPYNYQAMLFWAGLRGAVGVALAAAFTGKSRFALQATVLVVVVLTVIIFGGTTARMLEILEIKTGVVEEIDSDDEFDIEAIHGGTWHKRSGTGIGFSAPRRGSTVPLGNLDSERNGSPGSRSGWASGHRSPNPMPRRQSSRLDVKNGNDHERVDLLGVSGNNTDSEIGSDIDTSDLPPPAPRRRPSPIPGGGNADLEAGPGERGSGWNRSTSNNEGGQSLSATAAIRQLFSSEDPTALFRQFDENYIKPKLLLDGGTGRGGHGGPSGSG